MARRSSSRYRGCGNLSRGRALEVGVSRSAVRCYPPGEMPRLRLLLPTLLVLAIVAVVVTDLVGTRVRARAQSDWLQGRNLTLAPAAKGLKEPTFVAFPPDGSKRLFVLEREGRVRVVDGDGKLLPTPLLDVSDNTSTSTEQGMLGLAFD